MILTFLGASIEPKVIFIAAAIIIGIINAWMEKKKKDRESANPSSPSAPRGQAPAPRGGSDEQERLRRFMESLGVPQPSHPQRTQPAPAPPVTRPRQQPTHSQNRPRPSDPRMQPQRPAAKARTKPAPRPFAMSDPEEMQRAGRLEESAASIERIAGEFSAMNVRVAMEPVQTLESAAHLASGAAGTTSVTERDISPIVATVRRLLQKPADLRAAFVTVEILGPPRGLQG